MTGDCPVIKRIELTEAELVATGRKPDTAEHQTKRRHVHGARAPPPGDKPERKVERLSEARAQRNVDFKSNRFKIYRVKRLSELLDVNGSTIWRWRRNGTLPEPAFKQGNIQGWTEQQLEPLFKQFGLGGGDA
jgi:hypothetical protein